MKAFSNAPKTALVALLAFGLNGCASEAAPIVLETGSPVLAEAPVTVSPDSKFTFERIEVKTIPAPIVLPEPEPVVPQPEPEAPLVTAPLTPVTIQPVSPPVVAPAPKPVAPAPKVAAPPPAAPVPADEMAWINATMAKYGVYPPEGTQYVIGPMPAGCEGASGCTTYSYYPDTGEVFDLVITLLPQTFSEYLLFHEIGHAKGIEDECEADNYARSVIGPALGFYCN